MTRRNRPRIYDDEEEDEGHVPQRRTRGVVTSYTEPEIDLGIDDEFSTNQDDTPIAPAEDNYDYEFKDEGYNDEDEDINVNRRKSRRSRATRAKVESDDEFYEDEIVSDDDEFLQKLEHDNFIAPEDDNNDFGYDYSNLNSRKRRRRNGGNGNGARTRAKDVVPIGGDELDDNIHEEIAELYDSSPTISPIKHKLRDRQTKVDYTIPPPMTNNNQHASPYKSKGKRPNVNKFEYRKLLYPTAGPFGGSDVLSIFGTNIPPGGIPVPGLTNVSNMTAIGQNVSDSDSSDDEIVAVNQTNPVDPTAAMTPKNKPNHTQLINAGSANPKDKTKNNLSDTDPLGVDMNIDFSMVGGLDNYINQLKEMVALPLLYPELYQNFAITPPRGVLFHGPPGTGKTLMARALAASCSTEERKITFYMRKGADCLSKWVGEAERQLRLLFEEAKKNQPSIIFFDEIDGLAPVRSSKQEQIHASIVSTLLALMDGMDNRGQVIVIGATNRPDSIDPALRRPGRFDREFYFPLPDINSRKDILKIQTKKWTPPLQDDFVSKLSELTKGYGGADLRALCTEAALNSIQRKYPQIYKSNDKLQVNPSKIHVIAKDFMKALDTIVPSSARSSSTGSAPLPEHLSSVLKHSLDEVTGKLNHLLPNAVGLAGKKKPTALDEAMYLDPTVNDPDGGFARQQLLKNLESSRICKPNLLICGSEGNGQQYISAAILNYLEGFQVQSLDMGNIFGDASRTPELSIVQAFIEARRHQPSIIFIPNIDIWFQVVPYPAKATLTSLLRNLKSNEQVLLLGVSETKLENLDLEIKSIFGFNNPTNNVHLQNPNREQRREFFKSLNSALLMKPFEFVNDLENRPKRKLKQLKVAKPKEVENKEATEKKKLKQRIYQDTKLKNLLKIKLAGLMDLFKNRYKRFKKPIIDEGLLYHLFDPSILDNPLLQYEVQYVKSEDKEHEHMIKELHTGKHYYNMDLDVIEERLWNGFYSEPKQFLKDIRLIVKDSMTSGDRDRILKANEMLTNAQFAIDEFSTPEFLKACKELREREIETQNKLLEDHKKLELEFQNQKVVEVTEATEIQPVLEPALPIESTIPIESVLPTELALPIDSAPQIESALPIDQLVNPPETELSMEVDVNTHNGSNGNEFIAPIVPLGQELNAFENNLEDTEMVGPNAPVDVGTYNVTIKLGEPKNPEPEVTQMVVEANGDIETKESETKEPETREPETKEPETKEPETKPKETEEVLETEPESEPESEIDEGVQIEMDRGLIIDESKLQQFFEESLIESTENCNIEKLEIVMARLMDIVWTDRNVWDKTGTINQLTQEVETLKTSFNS